MFKKRLTLTATTCRILEEVRIALEVLLGHRVRFKHLELDKSDGRTYGHGALFLRDKEIPIIFCKLYESPGSEIYYELKVDTVWYIARFDTPEMVRVARSNVAGTDWIVGTSAEDRRKEPLRVLPQINY